MYVSIYLGMLYQFRFLNNASPIGGSSKLLYSHDAWNVEKASYNTYQQAKGFNWSGDQVKWTQEKNYVAERDICYPKLQSSKYSHEEKYKDTNLLLFPST